MKQKDLEEELNKKKEIALADFKLLSAKGLINFYEECEFTHVFIFRVADKTIHHYFGLIVYEDYLETVKNETPYLTQKLISINKEYKLGVMRTRITGSESQNFFYNMMSGKLISDTTEVNIPTEYQLLPKAFIPDSGGDDSPVVSKILKPNYWGNNYIIEFCSINNPWKEKFNQKEINAINQSIQKHAYLDFNSVFDRIGNFIFQFPITIFKAESHISRARCECYIDIDFHPRFSTKSDIEIQIKTSLDDITTGFSTTKFNPGKSTLEIGDSNNLEALVYDRKNRLVLHHSKKIIVRNIEYNIVFGTQNSEPRTIHNDDGKTVEIFLLSDNTSNSSSDIYYDSRIRERIKHNHIINNSGDWKVFKFKKDEKDLKALKYIREKLNARSSSSSEIWLWDPFLKSDDIIDTLYYVEKQNIHFRCISSYKKAGGHTHKDFDCYRNAEVGNFRKRSNNLGISIEFRSQHSGLGYNFHDRFLIFMPKDTTAIPTVYSLGTSVNSLGKSHHIIQQALDPRIIIENFQDLWKALDNEKCLVFKLPEVTNAQ